jgi:hypothetical protein
MKQIKITISKRIARPYLFNAKKLVTDCLATMNMQVQSTTYANFGDLVIVADLKEDVKYRMIKSYLIDEMPSYITVQLIDKPFDLEDYRDTDLDGSALEGEAQQMLLAFDTLIDKTLVGATTEYKKQARMEIGRLVKENVDRWIENNESIHP